jgi:hypothetical protein
MRMAKPKELALATIVAPLLGAVIGMLPYFMIAAAITDLSSFLSALGFALLTAFYVGGILGIPAAIAIGLPVHAALLRFDMRQAWHYAIVGVAPGMAIGSLLLFLISDAPDNVANWTLLLALGAFTGTMTASIFWLIRHPDRDPPNPANSVS